LPLLYNFLARVLQLYNYCWLTRIFVNHIKRNFFPILKHQLKKLREVVFLQVSFWLFKLFIHTDLLLTNIYTIVLQVENMGRINYGAYIFDRKVSITLPFASCSICIHHGYKLLVLISAQFWNTGNTISYSNRWCHSPSLENVSTYIQFTGQPSKTPTNHSNAWC